MFLWGPVPPMCSPLWRPGVSRPESGRILLDGENIAGKSCVEINQRGIARTFQNIRLFHQLSVLDNVKAGFYHHFPYSLLDAVLHTPRYFRQEKEMDKRAEELLSVFEYLGQKLREKGGLSHAH